MADIHLHTPGGATLVRSEEQVEELVRSGLIASDVLYWRAGMTEWSSIRTYLSSTSSASPTAGPVTPPAPERVVGRRRFSLRRNPEPMTTIVQVLLLVLICTTALELINSLARFHTVKTYVPDTSPDTTTVSTVATDGTQALPAPDGGDEAGLLLEWIGWGLNALLVIPYFIWLYRMSMNCHNFSSIMRFSPRWAVGCYFVPAIQLFRPCQVMQEIWRVSSNPRTWHNDRNSYLVGFWWLLTLATIALSVSSWLNTLEARAHSQQVTAALLFLILKAVQLACYGLFFWMVTAIVQRQLRVVNSTRRRAETEGGR